MKKERQKNLSKAIYDIGKYIFVGLVIGYFINPKINIIIL